jgi:hypothetical protein
MLGKTITIRVSSVDIQRLRLIAKFHASDSSNIIRRLIQKEYECVKKCMPTLFNSDSVLNHRQMLDSVSPHKSMF